LVMGFSSARVSSTCTERDNCTYEDLVALIALLMLPLAFCLRSFIRSAAGIDEQLLRFDCLEAECWDPVDRDVIRDEIIRCHGSLEAFNDFVRGPLRRQVIATSRYDSWPPYYMALVMTSACFCQQVEWVITSASSLSLIHAAMVCICRSTDALCIGPLGVRLWMFLVGLSVQWRSYKSEFAKVCTVMISVCLTMALYALMIWVSLVHVVAAISYCIVGMILTWLMFFRQPVSCWRG